MKRKNQSIMLLALCIILTVIISGCASAKNGNENHSAKKADSTAEPSVQEESKEEPDPAGNRLDLPQNEQFIVRTRLSVETEEFEESVKKIEKLTVDLKGYIETVEANYGTTYDRSRNRSVFYLLRIPKGSSTAAVRSIKSDVGQVVEEQMSTENVTKRIRDIKRDIELLKAKEDRLLELSKRTEDIEALIRIESELAEIISEREYNQASLQNLEYDVQYDFLSVYLQEVRETKAIEEDSFAGDIRKAFRDSIDGMVSFFQGLVLFFVRTWFALLLLVLIVFVIVLLVRKISKRIDKFDSKERMTDFRPSQPTEHMPPDADYGVPQPDRKK